MSEIIQVQWKTGSIDEARRVCRYLVQERLVAQAHIVPWVESISMLDNQLHTEQETEVQLLTRKANYAQVRELIESNTKFEQPQVTYHILDGCNESFQSWVEDSTPSLVS